MESTLHRILLRRRVLVLEQPLLSRHDAVSLGGFLALELAARFSGVYLSEILFGVRSFVIVAATEEKVEHSPTVLNFEF